MRDACQDGENKERREQGSLSLSLSPRERLVAPASFSSRAAASRINGTGNTKQRARARTHYAHGREMRACVYHPQSFATTCLSRDFHATHTVEAPGHRGTETPHVRIFEMGSPRALKEPIANLSEKRRRSFRSRDLQKIISNCKISLPSGKI